MNMCGTMATTDDDGDDRQRPFTGTIKHIIFVVVSFNKWVESRKWMEHKLKIWRAREGRGEGKRGGGGGGRAVKKENNENMHTNGEIDGIRLAIQFVQHAWNGSTEKAYPPFARWLLAGSYNL